MVKLTKKQRQSILVGIIIIGIILFMSQGGFNDIFAVSSSLVIKSIDSLAIISNNADLNNINKGFRILASVGGGAEEVVGSISDSKFNEALDKKGNNAWKTDFDLTFKADIIQEEAIYPIIIELTAKISLNPP